MLKNLICHNKAKEALRAEQVLDMCFIPKPSILEIGSGTGAWFTTLDRRVPDMQYLGMDCDVNAVNYSIRNTMGKYVVRDANGPWLLDEKYDIILISNSLIFLNFDHVVIEIQKYLKPHGVVIVRDFDQESKMLYPFSVKHHRIIRDHAIKVSPYDTTIGRKLVSEGAKRGLNLISIRPYCFCTHFDILTKVVKQYVLNDLEYNVMCAENLWEQHLQQSIRYWRRKIDRCEEELFVPGFFYTMTEFIATFKIRH